MANPGNKSIHINKLLLPTLEEFMPYLEEIWASKKLTNNGPFYSHLENALCDYLGVERVDFFRVYFKIYSDAFNPQSSRISIK
ncbi:MAG: hypothetical protein PHT53_06625 [Candidatus Omnitrophica bacterium]|nr:hypothetical protein [Candidatus Omnitrophota bacterium]